ncbi:ogr/Delta-like zinc finger family protein [Sphingobium sp. AN558]|uniref:ogr/Delta-like zinc finger family protein n=1 Tax=Sphingobium sp. AN558 TaxID=3133442 RepID=UPI0030C4F745
MNTEVERGEQADTGKPRMPHFTCPACSERAFARNSGKASSLYREIYYHCRNVVDCGHQFVVGMEALRTTRPSRVTKPLAVLPFTTWRPAANDDAANDDGPPGAAAAHIMTS